MAEGNRQDRSVYKKGRAHQSDPNYMDINECSGRKIKCGDK